MEYFTASPLIFSFIITWTIGLALLLLIRYALLRRQMTKTSAIATCAFFWFFIIFLFTSMGPAVVLAQQSTFAILQFDNGITIEVPRNWTYLDDNIKQQLNNSSEAIVKLSGTPLNQGDNQILIAANAYTTFNKPSATMRISVRPGKYPTQLEMRQLSQTSKAELSEILTPIIAATKRAILSMEGVRSVTLRDARIEQSKHLACLFTEFEKDTSDGLTLSQTYVCPAGDKSIKLSTSYRKSEATLFKPVLQYIWHSLTVVKKATP